MAHAQFLDELIKEYLVFRGFPASLKVFEAELKADKEKSFRADKIVEQIVQFVNTYDLNSIRELWAHLSTHMFFKLEKHFHLGVKKLEHGIFKFYLANATSNGKTDRVLDFFIKMTPELQHQAEWKDWFVLPYIKNAEDNPTFAVYFTKQWQDTLLVSLYNFLATIFQHMPMPTLMQYEEDAKKIYKLEQRNESLRSRLALLIDKGPETNVKPCVVDPPPDLLDDFYIIAQENNTTDSQARSLRNLIRLGAGSSPVLGRKDISGAKRRVNSSSRS